MARLRTQKTSFTGGEVSPRLLGRSDLRAYDNGASKLRNVFIHSTGGLSRRSGLRYIDTVDGDGRLVAFEFNTEQVYLMVFTHQKVEVFKDGQSIYAITSAPWTAAQVAQINWTQTADTLLVVHPDVKPKKIVRNDSEQFTIEDWVFIEEDEDKEQGGGTVHYNRIQHPHHKFADEDVTVTPSGLSGTITVTASANVFQAGHAGLRMRIENKEIVIDTYTSPTQVQATVKENLANTNATKDWEEQAFSDIHGWPTSVCFHQDRMVIGGSRDLPNRLWMSKSADLFNFDLAEGLDDEAIEFAILSDQVNAIRAVFSGRHLQVFTSGAEWMVTGDPLTPGSVQLKRQTRIGSPVERTVPPRDVDGATLFIPRNGPELREFLFADVEQAYQASDLAMLAQHLIDDPVDLDYETGSRLFHLVMSSGDLATLTIYRAEQVTAWTLQETDGTVKSVAVVDNETYLLIERGGAYLLEKFDKKISVDSGITDTDLTPKTQWSNLGHLEGKTVTILADGAVRANQVVTGGAITLSEPASTVQIGLPFTHTVEPLPPTLGGQGGSQGGKVRAVSVTLRLQDTASLRIDVGRGFVKIPFKRFGSEILDAAPPIFSGDKKIRTFGWTGDGIKPLWQIQDDAPLPFHLLSVTAEISANG